MLKIDISECRRNMIISEEAFNVCVCMMAVGMRQLTIENIPVFQLRSQMLLGSVPTFNLQAMAGIAINATEQDDVEFGLRVYRKLRAQTAQTLGLEELEWSLNERDQETEVHAQLSSGRPAYKGLQWLGRPLEAEEVANDAR